MELAELKKNLQIQLINYFNVTNGQDTEDSKKRVKKLAENLKAIGIEFDEKTILNIEKYPEAFMDLIAYSEFNILTKIVKIKNILQGDS